MIVPLAEDSPRPSDARAEELYTYLPAIYRIQDEQMAAATGDERRRGPLFELVRVIAAGAEAVERDIARLYADAFIETCDEWVVPYIADLVGYRPVADAGEPGSPDTAAGRALNRALTSRREVARTIYLRRRKGALHLLEQLARDVAGWPARAVEGFDRVALFDTDRRYPQDHGATLRVSDPSALGRLGGPFESLTRSVDLRSPEPRDRSGRAALRTVTLYAWTTRAYPVTFAAPKRLRAQCYTFDPAGISLPLYISPAPEARPADIAGELNLPARLRTQALIDHKQALYGPGLSLCVYRDDGRGFEPVPADQIIPADLPDAGGGWAYRPYDGETSDRPPDGHVAVDPERGRLMIQEHEPPHQLRVSYHYGFGADIGAGEYPRTDSIDGWPARGSRWPHVEKALPLPFPPAPDGTDKSPTKLATALEAWGDEGGTCRFADSSLYRLAAPLDAPLTIKLKEQPEWRTHSQQTVYALRASSTARPTLAIRAERESGQHKIDPAVLLQGLLLDQPLAGQLEIDAGAGSAVLLEGLLLDHGNIVFTGRPASICIRNCTFSPGAEPSRLRFELDSRAQTEIRIERCIAGPLPFLTQSEQMRVSITDSILLGARADSSLFSLPGTSAQIELTVECSTLVGTVAVRAIPLARNSIFMGRVQVEQKEPNEQASQASYCYLPTNPGADPTHPADGIARLNCPSHRDRPRFISSRYGHPQLCRLHHDCPATIGRGADDGGELGAYHHLYLPQRRAVLEARLEEYCVAAMDHQLIIVE